MTKARWFSQFAACGVLLASIVLGAPAARAGNDDGAATTAATSRPPTDDPTVYVVIGVAHSDIVLPRAAFANAPPRVKAAVDQLTGGPWIIIGWGPYWFGRDEPGDAYHPAGLRTANLVWTLLAPQMKSRLRVGALQAPGAAPDERYVQLIPVELSAAGLGRAVARIDHTFKGGADGEPIVTYRPPSQPNVAIFLSDEHYSLAHECDHWVAEVLRAGGINVATGLEFTPAMLALSLGNRAPPPSAPAPALDAAR